MDDYSTIWTNANLATMSEGGAGYGAITGAALVVTGGRIAWAGPAEELPRRFQSENTEAYDLDGGWITPGFIDCHTHLVYGGSRAREFEMRLSGADYRDIAAAGGGILATVTATRAADETQLLNSARSRLEALKRDGVTTVEIKSGYGLDLETEMRILRVARRLAEEDDAVDVVTTYLGLHALPPEFAGDRAGYVREVIEKMLPAIADAGLADSVDAFCENIAFSTEEVGAFFSNAAMLDLPAKLHADQLSALGGGSLAASFQCLSADHLEYSTEADIKALADGGCAAVLLPGAFYTLRETRVPPVDLLRAYGVPIAVATDCNPGSSPIASLLLIMNMACTLFRLTPAEALAGVTCNAAKALGLESDRGTLAEGMRADFVVWDIDEPAALAYAVGMHRPCAVIKDGTVHPRTPRAREWMR